MIYKLQCHTTRPLFSAILYRRTDAGQSKGMPVRSAIEKSHIFIYEAYRNKEYQKASDLMKEHLKQSLEYALQCI